LRSPPASGLYSRAHAHAPSYLPRPRASRPPSAPQSPTAHPTASATPCVAFLARGLRSPPAQPRAPVAWPVPFVPVNRSSARLSRPTAPSARMRLRVPSATSPIAHRSLVPPQQSLAHINHPTSTPCAPLRKTIKRH
ncbi:Unknown protein, partial [Striga hermonthica]